jgi:hypothetical protein
MGDYAPYRESIVGGYHYRVERLVGGYQPNSVGLYLDAFERKLSVDTAYGQIAILGLKRAVDDEQVALFDAFVYH